MKLYTTNSKNLLLTNNNINNSLGLVCFSTSSNNLVNSVENNPAIDSSSNTENISTSLDGEAVIISTKDKNKHSSEKKPLWKWETKRSVYLRLNELYIGITPPFWVVFLPTPYRVNIL